MTRKEFLKMSALLGIGLPMSSTLFSCSNLTSSSNNKPDNVIIIGAGAAGLSAAYLLKQQGINFQILEANSYHGGRMIRTNDFTDFPIPLGAEWLHVERDIFDEIVNDPSINIEIETTPYSDSDWGLYEGEQLSPRQFGFTIDQKFINASWFDFFEQYVTPSVIDNISFEKVVRSINYSGDQVEIRTDNEVFTADKLILTIPVKMLQLASIEFTPQLPTNKINALNEINVWDGCKAFIEFSEKFYPNFVGFEISPSSAGQKMYYDAAYGQNTEKNILGLFAVGTGTKPYVDLNNSDLKDYILNELDELFEGKASQTYVKHLFQNWNEQAFAQGAYVGDQEDWRKVRTLGESISNKIFFAGCSYTNGDDWGSVHTAAQSAKTAVREIIG